MGWSLGRRAAVSCAGVVTFALSPQLAHAQLTGNTVVDNHPLTTNFTTTYSAAAPAGSPPSRALIAIIQSETDRNAVTQAPVVTLGGTALTFLDTLENANPDPAITNKNRLSIFVLDEARIPAGSASLNIDYGTVNTASLVYLTTALRIQQTGLLSTAVALDKDCPNSGTIQGGTVPFAGVAAQPSDLVLSFVGTGRRQATTVFNNGGTEIFDTAVSGPGFSFAGAVQSPQTAATVAGTATISEGCNRRPITAQMVLRPLGSTATLVEDEQVVEGDPFTLTVTDADRNTLSGGVDSLEVVVTNPRTGESATVVLVETGPNTGVFSGQLPTSADPAPGSDTDGVLNVQVGDQLVGRYEDTLTDSGGTATLTDTTVVVGVGAPELTGKKTVASVSSYNTPGSDVLYTLTVSNTGNTSTDAGTLFMVDTLPPEISFFFGDPISGDGSTDPVLFTQDPSAGLDWSFPRDAGFSRASTPPASMAACNDAPGTGYDPTVRHVCFAPGNSFAPGPPGSPPSWSVTFRARVE